MQVEEAFVIKHTSQPIELSTGKKANAYYLGEAGYNKLKSATTDKDLQPIREQIYELTQFLHQLIEIPAISSSVVRRFADLIETNLPKNKATRHYDVRKLHPALEFSIKTTLSALDLLIKEGRVVEKHGWIRLAKKETDT